MTPERERRLITGRFTTEELLALAGGLGLPLPWLLRGSPIESWPEAVRGEIEQVGTRSLLARQMISQATEGFATTAPVRQMMQVICEPLLSIGVVRVADGSTAYWTYVARPDWAVAHAVSDVGIHTVSIFPTSDLLAAVVASSGLRRADQQERSEVTVLAGAVTDMATAEVEGLEDREVWAARGFDAAASDLMSRLSREDRSSSIVTVLHPTSSHAIAGSMTAWIDGNEDGLWMLEPGEHDTPGRTPLEEEIRFLPADSDMILESIRSGLPTSDLTVGA